MGLDSEFGFVSSITNARVVLVLSSYESGSSVGADRRESLEELEWDVIK